MENDKIIKSLGNAIGEDLTPPSQEMETEKGLVKVGDKVVALGKEYQIFSIQQGFLFSKDEKGKKLGIKPDLIEEIKPQNESN